MSSRVTPKGAGELLRKGLQDDADLMKDISALLSFAATTTSATSRPLIAALGVLLQTTGSIVSAAVNLIGRFRDNDGQPADSFQPYERFNVLFLLTTVRAYMEALDEVVTTELTRLKDEEKKKKRKKKNDASPDTNSENKRQVALEEVRIRARDVDDADLTYLFGVEPLTDEVPLLTALRDWLVASLVALGLNAYEAKKLAEACDGAARSRFRVIVADDNPESTWMRNFLALDSQSVVKASIDDLRATTLILQDWLIDHETPSSSQDAWNEYRDVLARLPHLPATMYSESFGVSEVFQAPIVQYHVAGARGEAGMAHEINDVGRLLGALVSTRTQGQDLIILSGGPGSGKSTLCRVFASELAQSSKAYPIFLQLRRVKEGAEITQFIEEALQSQGLVTRISELMQLPNVVVILDGFDELVAANRSRLRQFFNVLLDETQTGPLRNAHVIVSGRDTLFPGGQGLPVGSHVVALQPFDRMRVEAWGSRWRSQHASGSGSTFHPELFLSDSDRKVAPHAVDSPLEHLVTWPLTLHLVARVHTAGGLPSPTEAGARIDKAYLYRSILAETSERQSGQVVGEGRLEPEAMRKFLRSVAWLMYIRSVDSLDVVDVTPLLESLRDEHGGLDSSQLAEVAVLNAPELARGEETGFEFVHKSFSEFLAAENIAEQVERASFKVLEYDSQAPAWRMSDVEASTALAEVLGIRLLPEEIQEMLEPMLGAVLRFRAGQGVEDTVPLEERRDGLGDVLQRCESLYASALAGAGEFSRLDEIVTGAPGVGNVLEGMANYLVGLAIVGCAAARQLTEGSVISKFSAESEPGAMWRFLALAHAGGITLDESLGERIFPLMTVRNGGDEVSDTSLPWKLHVLDKMDGYKSEIEPVVQRALSAHRMTTRLMVILAVVLRSQVMFARSRDEPRMMPSRYRPRDVWERMRHGLPHDDAATELAFVLGRLGAISPQLVRELSERDVYGDRQLAEALRYMEHELEMAPAAGEWRRLLEHTLMEMADSGANRWLVQEIGEMLLSDASLR
jgi:hypothetical protein